MHERDAAAPSRSSRRVRERHDFRERGRARLVHPPRIMRSTGTVTALVTLAALLALGACSQETERSAEPPAPAAPPSAGGGADVSPAPGAPPLVTMRCADPMRGASFVVHERGRFRLRVLPDTAAEDDLDDIAAKREHAFARITAALAIVEPRTIDLVLSPSRAAADAHGVGAGRALPERAEIAVLYLDGADSYEKRRYGHELMHVLSHQIDPAHRYHVKILDEGIAEVMDHSGRDSHLAAAQELRATRQVSPEASLEAYLTFDDDDVLGARYGKAGSFVKRLLDVDPDPARFRAFYADLWQKWAGDSPFAPDGAELTGAKLNAVVDDALTARYGTDLATFRAGWRSAVQAHLDAPAATVSAGDRAEIEALFARRDAAISSGDAGGYRATMEAFYCDRVTEEERAEVAAKAATGAPTRTTVKEILETGIKNYPTVQVSFVEETSGNARDRVAWLERFPVGWRLSYVR